MIAIKGMTMSKDSEGCISCAFHWNGDSTTYCLAQSTGRKLHHIDYTSYENIPKDYEGKEEIYNACIKWREETCPLIEVEPYKEEGAE